MLPWVERRVVRWEPELSPGEAQRREYTTHGEKSLGEGRTDVSGLTDAERQAQGYRFFSVGVRMK